MSHSVSGSVISTSPAEDEIKRDFKLVVEELVAIGLAWELNANQESRLEAWSGTGSLQRRNLLDIAGRDKRGTLSQISSNKRSLHRVLSERRSTLLERRAIRTDLIVARLGVTRSTQAVTIPSSNLSKTLILIELDLPERGHLQPDRSDTDLIKNASNMCILRCRAKNIPHTQVHRAGLFARGNSKDLIFAVFQTEAGCVSLLHHARVLQGSGTTRTTKARPSVPSVHTGTRTVTTTVSHTLEWCWTQSLTCE